MTHADLSLWLRLIHILCLDAGDSPPSGISFPMAIPVVMAVVGLLIEEEVLEDAIMDVTCVIVAISFVNNVIMPTTLLLGVGSSLGILQINHLK